jgi:hypothetical protein
MGGACGTQGEVWNAYKILVTNPLRGDNTEDIDTG